MPPIPVTSTFQSKFPSNSATAAAASTAANNLNTQNNQRYRYQSEIQAMMYTFGDVKQPLSSTSLLVEDIVHSQIIELVRPCLDCISISVFYCFYRVVGEGFGCCEQERCTCNRS